MYFTKITNSETETDGSMEESTKIQTLIFFWLQNAHS